MHTNDLKHQKEKITYQIRTAEESDWDEAMELAFQTFLKYEAQDYGEEGVKSFANFITDNTLKNFFLLGNYKLFIAETDKQIIGLISLRSGNHISLLFVDEKYHRMGIGKSLVSHVQQYLLKETHFSKITVNASPYGVPFYHATGFKDMGPQTKQDGIIFTPMERYL